LGLTAILTPLAVAGALALAFIAVAWRSWRKFERGLDAE